MKLAFEVSSLAKANPSGIARYIRNITEQLLQYEQIEKPSYCYYKFSKLKKKQYWPEIPGTINKTYGLPTLLNRKIDVIHGLDGWVPNWRNCKKVASLHDLLVLKYNDDALCSPSFRQAKAKKCQQLAKVADAILAPSQQTQADIIELIGIPEEKVFLVPLGVEDRFIQNTHIANPNFKKQHNLVEDFLLFVGDISYRKNIHRLIPAYAQSEAKNTHKLVLAGNLAYDNAELSNLIQQHKVDKQVHIIGYVADKDLPALYTAASGFVFPTLYEGFGIPLLEAMACGTPVLTSNRGSAPEVCAEHAILVNPLEIESIANGIDQLSKITQTQKNAAIEHAKSYTWERCAKATLDVYKKILAT